MIVMSMLAPLAAMLIQMAISRSRSIKRTLRAPGLQGIPTASRMP